MGGDVKREKIIREGEGEGGVKVEDGEKEEEGKKGRSQEAGKRKWGVGGEVEAAEEN